MPMSGMTKKEDGHTLLNSLLKQKCFQWMWRQSMVGKTPNGFLDELQ